MDALSRIYLELYNVRVLYLRLAVSGVTFYNILYKSCRPVLLLEKIDEKLQVTAKRLSAPHHEWEYDM